MYRHNRKKPNLVPKGRVGEMGLVKELEEDESSQTIIIPERRIYAPHEHSGE